MDLPPTPHPLDYPWISQCPTVLGSIGRLPPKPATPKNMLVEANWPHWRCFRPLCQFANKRLLANWHSGLTHRQCGQLASTKQRLPEEGARLAGRGYFQLLPCRFAACSLSVVHCSLSVVHHFGLACCWTSYGIVGQY